MTTLADVIAATRSEYFTTYRPQVNILTDDITAAVDQVKVSDDIGAMQAGAEISIGLEVMRVRTVAGQTATVIRGWGGSTPAAHLAGVPVWVNSQITDFGIYRAIVNELHDLSTPASGLFKVATEEFAFNASVYSYAITAPDVLEILEVRYRAPGPENTWPRIGNYKFAESENVGDFPSGNAITFYEGAYPGAVVHVKVAVPFTVPTAVTDDMQTVVGLPATANDIPPLGAAIRLSNGREIQRNFNENQGQPRRSDEVPAGANLGSNRMLMQLRAQRINAEAGRLRSSYPQYRR